MTTEKTTKPVKKTISNYAATTTMRNSFNEIVKLLQRLDASAERFECANDGSPKQAAPTTRYVREQLTSLLEAYRVANNRTAITDTVLPLNTINFGHARIYCEEDKDSELHHRYGVVLWFGSTPTLPTMHKVADINFVDVPNNIIIKTALETHNLLHIASDARRAGTAQPTVGYAVEYGVEPQIAATDAAIGDLVLGTRYGIMLTGFGVHGVEATAVTCSRYNAPHFEVFSATPLHKDRQAKGVRTAVTPAGLVRIIRNQLKVIAPAQAMVYGALEAAAEAINTARHQARLTTAALTAFTINDNEAVAQQQQQKNATKKPKPAKQQP